MATRGGRPPGVKPGLPTIEFDEGSLGPAMRALRPLQRAFVHYKVFYGLTNIEAYRRAGYSDNPGSSRKGSYELAHSQGVQDAIEEETRKLMRTEGPKSVQVLVEIRDDKEVAARDRVKAATELLNRAGLHARTESTVNVSVQMTDSEKDKEILRLAKELGLGETEAKKLLISPDDFKQNAKGVYELEPKPNRPSWRDTENERRRARSAMTPEEREADKARVRQEMAEYARDKGKRIYAEHQARIAAEEAVPEYVDINLVDDTENEPESQDE